MSTYGNSPYDYIDLFKDRLLYVGKQFDSETQQIADARHDFNDAGFTLIDEIKKIDEEIIKRAGELGKYIHDEDHYDDEMKSFWAWNPDKIAEGKFPLEKIPDHVRTLAKELYY
ncbi:MAG TPA: hypothetical protein PK573_08400 [Spirochaetota bacterium]|nr:hypothetical protein [Spirochaetota bacterium]HRZ28885.1 hypothetical protein [Spirochaetota bacterium]HSA15839.1 hypothetical protein [Spirochaetota bacterium]